MRKHTIQLFYTEDTEHLIQDDYFSSHGLEVTSLDSLSDLIQLSGARGAFLLLTGNVFLLEQLKKDQSFNPEHSLVFYQTRGEPLPFPCRSVLDSSLPEAVLRKLLLNELELLRLHQKRFQLEDELITAEIVIQGLQTIASALTNEKNLDNLQKIIIRTCTQITHSDAGAVYLIKDNPRVSGEKQLCFMLNQNYSLEIDSVPFTMPLDKRSIAGYVALTKEILNIPDSYQLPPDAEYGHNKQFDQMYQYFTRSILTIPMLDYNRNVIGVIQLVNKKPRYDMLLRKKEDFDSLVMPFSAWDEKFAFALASQAAIAIENAILYENIRDKARLEQEMEIAEDIQTSLLPEITENQHYEMAAYMRTANEVGGDYYDFQLSSLPYFGVFGDVSGHGLKSGLVMLMAEVAFTMLMQEPGSKTAPLEELYQKINATLYQNIQERLAQKSRLGAGYSHLYMTFRLFRFDEAGRFEMFGNDHAEPFICRAESGQIEVLPSTGFLLGIVEETLLGASALSFQLEKDDLLILYSDGISEAKKESRAEGAKSGADERTEFGEARLQELVSQNRHLSVTELVKLIIDTVSGFMAEQEDDITLAILRKR